MTPDERLAMDEAMLDCLDAHEQAILTALNANDDVGVAHEMTSALLAICQSLQIENNKLRRNYDLAVADLQRYTRSAVSRA